MIKPKMAVPLEDAEQEAFVQWLELNGLLFSSTAQSTYTTSWNQKRKNHDTGLRKGVPDLLIIIPADKSADDKPYLLFIEMKRTKGGVISPEQHIWIDSINSILADDVAAFVAYGADEAIKIVEPYLKPVENSYLF